MLNTPNVENFHAATVIQSWHISPADRGVRMYCKVRLILLLQASFKVLHILHIQPEQSKHLTESISSTNVVYGCILQVSPHFIGLLET